MRRSRTGVIALGRTAFAAALLGYGLCGPAALAQQASDPVQRPGTSQGDLMLRGQSATDANAGTVSIVTARTPTGTMTQATVDLSTLLDKGERFEIMRVIPIISRGKMQNLWDLLYLKGVDAGYLQTDTLEYLKDDPQVASIKRRLRYIASMFPEEIHIIARPEIRTLKDLEGKKVSINAKGTGSAMTLPIILRRLGINAELEFESPNIAIERMKSGEMVAHTFVFGKPTQAVLKIDAPGFHLLPVPYTSELSDLYLPATFTHDDYPKLVPEGQEVETVAVGNVLAVFNWEEDSERYVKVARFTKAFFDNFAKLHKKGFHPKWQEVNIAADVPGWIRFKAAQEWLDANSAADKVANQKLQGEFRNYLGQRGGASLQPQEEQELFQRFLEWRKSRS